MLFFKNFARSFKENYIDYLIFRLLIIGLVVILSLGLSVFIESYIFTSHYSPDVYLSEEDIEFTYTDLKYDEAKDSYTVESDYASLSLNFPESYVYKIRFFGETVGDVPLYYTVISEDGYPVRDVDIYDSFNDNEETVVVDTYTSFITFYIHDSDGVTFSIKDLNLDFEIDSNPIRIFSTFIVILVFFYILFSVTGLTQFKYERMALVFILVLGILIAFLTPPRYSYDEFSHLMRAYHVSIGDFHTELFEKEYYPFGFEELNSVDYRSLDEYENVVNEYSEMKQYGGYYAQTPTTASSYLFVNYIFSAAGVLIARLLNVSILYYPFFGRIGNILFYALAVYWSLKLFKENQPLMFYVALTPIMISMAANLGTGILQNGCLFLGIALIAYFIRREEDIRSYEYLGLLILFVLITIARITSGFFMLLLLLIPSYKFDSDYLYRFNKFITIIVAGLTMGLTFYYSNSIGLALNAIEGVNVEAQLATILKDPMRFLYRMWNYTTRTYLNSGVLQDIGYIVYVGRIPGFYTFLGSILLIVLAFVGKPNELTFNSIWSKILLIATFVLSVGAAVATLYLTFTPVNSYTVNGFQTRYFLSPIIVPLLALETKNFYMKHKEKTVQVLSSFYIWFMLMLYVGTLVMKYYR